MKSQETNLEICKPKEVSFDTPKQIPQSDNQTTNKENLVPNVKVSRANTIPTRLFQSCKILPPENKRKHKDISADDDQFFSHSSFLHHSISFYTHNNISDILQDFRSFLVQPLHPTNIQVPKFSVDNGKDSIQDLEMSLATNEKNKDS